MLRAISCPVPNVHLFLYFTPVAALLALVGAVSRADDVTLTRTHILRSRDGQVRIFRGGARLVTGLAFIIVELIAEHAHDALRGCVDVQLRQEPGGPMITPDHFAVISILHFVWRPILGFARSFAKGIQVNVVGGVQCAVGCNLLPVAGRRTVRQPDKIPRAAAHPSKNQ